MLNLFRGQILIGYQCFFNCSSSGKKTKFFPYYCFCVVVISCVVDFSTELKQLFKLYRYS